MNSCSPSWTKYYSPSFHQQTGSWTHFDTRKPFCKQKPKKKINKCNQQMENQYQQNQWCYGRYFVITKRRSQITCRKSFQRAVSQGLPVPSSLDNWPERTIFETGELGPSLQLRWKRTLSSGLPDLLAESQNWEARRSHILLPRSKKAPPACLSTIFPRLAVSSVAGNEGVSRAKSMYNDNKMLAFRERLS